MADDPKTGRTTPPPGRWRRIAADRRAQAAVAVVLLAGAGAWLYQSGVLARYGTELAPETYGRIYVESPEVYTRQRLVNDRLAQDAWLNRQLETIDAETSRFIEAWSEQRLELDVALRAGSGTPAQASAAAPADEDGDTPGTAAAPASTATLAPWWAETPETPFQVLFDLKASARDKIRQLILENALDDRHDLSGNTVYGLKFDTAIVPGSNTQLRPTVIVKMRVDPFPPPENGTDDPAAIERAIVLGAAGLPVEDRHADAFVRLQRHFENWHRNIGVRLNDYLEGAVCPADGAAVGVRVPEPVRAEIARQTEVLNASMVADKVDVFASYGRAGTRAPEFTPLETCLQVNHPPTEAYFPPQIDSAVRHVLSLPNQDPNSVIKKMLRNILHTNDISEIACRATYGDLDGTERPDFGVSLPEPWGKLFHLSVDLDPVTFRVQPRVRPILLTEADVNAEMSVPIPSLLMHQRCGVVERDVHGAVTGLECNHPAARGGRLHVYEETLGGRAQEADGPISLSETEVAALYATAPEMTFCAAKGRYQPMQWVPEASRGELCAETFRARRVAFQSGLYEFANRVREIDTYAYAAFPRGDVSGVVSEAGRSAGVSVGAQGPVGGVSASARDAERTRSVEARPMLVNFAAGEDSGEMFDFGWTVVKEGRKSPMMASQLVLVSVPAYLDQITMEITKGWLDSDVVLEDGEQWGSLPFEDRIARLLSEPERLTTTVHFPPDYQALDSLVAPQASRLGPLINKDAMRCSNGDMAGGLPTMDVVSGEAPSIVIPGARLWRSTVVTLGGEKAREIEVMPDMRGIIARFEPMVLAERPGGPAANAGLDLVVWTSEGRDGIPDFATLVPGKAPDPVDPPPEE